MNDFETLKQILARTQDYGWWFDDEKKEIVFPCDDDYYTLTLCFDEDGKLIGF